MERRHWILLMIGALLAGMIAGAAWMISWFR
jgi:hypothetical protein